MAPPPRRILVATDFSETANEAIPHAYSLMRSGGTVHLIHVLSQPRAIGNSPHEWIPELQASDRADSGELRECAARLRRLVPADAAEQGILSHVEVLQGHDVAQVICQDAERIGADIVCLGSHGASGIAKTLMGSVTREVMSRTQRRLFIVQPQPE